MSLTFDEASWPPTIAAVVTIVSVIFSLRWLLKCNMRTAGFPPGPPTLPVLGNIHQMPTKYPFLKYTEWSKEYGDIIGLKAGPLNIIILNSPDAIQSLFVQRAPIYSGRPVPYVARNFIYPGQEQALMFQNDAKLRKMRTSLRILTGPAGLKDALPMQDRVASKLVTRLRDHAHPAATCIGLWSFETALTSTVGPVGAEKAMPETFQWYTDVQHQLLDTIESVVALLYDIVPVMRYLPMSPGLESSARAIGKSLWNLYSDCMHRLKDHMAAVKDSGKDFGYEGLIATIMRRQEKGKDSVNQFNAGKADSGYTEAALTTMTQFITDAATDTTMSVALSCILALATNRNILQKAQEEVDQIRDLDSKTEPTYSDIGRFSYLKACILETLRWRTPAPLLLPHRIEHDDTFQGYHLPKDSIIMANIWAVLQDPRHFKDPDVFEPDRFMGDNVNKLPFHPFGLGKRICPGDQFATNSLMVALSKLLWHFDLVLDGSEPDLSIEGGYNTGMIPTPKSLPVKFVPRHI